MKRGLVLLDRDGTVIPDTGYRGSLQDCGFFEGAALALARLRNEGYRLAVATNQSGIARGIFGEDAVWAIHEELRRQLRVVGGDFDGLYFCPHHPEEGTPPYRCLCTCRKPLPGMLLQAARDFSVAAWDCWMIGDSARDIEAAHRAGMRAVLVRTGNGRETEELYTASALLEGVSVVEGLPEAADLILKVFGKRWEDTGNRAD